MTDAGYLHQRSKDFGKVPAELMHNNNLTDGAVRLYAHMHWRYGSNCRNFEGLTSMAETFDVSELTIVKRIQELEAADWVVTIERGKDAKTGKRVGVYKTPFYHVFELQEDCRNFRTTYQIQESECLREKPESRVRVSRRGKGGKPENLKRPHQLNSSLDGNQLNSSLDGRLNSGSGGQLNSSLDYPDSVHPDPFYPDTSSLPTSKEIGKWDRVKTLDYWRRYAAALDALRIASGMNTDMIHAEDMPDKDLKEYLLLFWDMCRMDVKADNYAAPVGYAKQQIAWTGRPLRTTDISKYLLEWKNKQAKPIVSYLAPEAPEDPARAAGEFVPREQVLEGLAALREKMKAV